MRGTLFALILLLTVTASGCSEIRFRNDSQVPSETKIVEWHDTILLGLIELDKPVNLNEACGGPRWNEVAVEGTFLQRLIEIVTIQLYKPEQVTVVCASKQISDTPAGNR